MLIFNLLFITQAAMAVPSPILFFFFFFLFLVKLALSDNIQFIFQGFKGNSIENLSLNGASVITSTGAIRLTNYSKNLIGRAFYSSPLHMFKTHSQNASSFSTTFVFVIVPLDPQIGGGHGLAFTLAPTQQLPGARFENYLGLLGPENNGNFSNHVFAVEFDTATGLWVNDIDGNHVGIDINSMNSTVSKAASYYANQTHPIEPLKLESGMPIQAWIEYDGTQKIVNVTISPLFVPKPSRPLLSAPVDLSHILKETMFAGFSSATGKLAGSHYILGWSFRMNGVAPPLNPSQLPSLPRPKISEKIRKEGIGIGAVCSATTLVLLVIVVFISLYYLQRLKYKDVLEEWELQCSHRFPYRDLFKATKGFKDSEILGSGGFGCVYKGVLPATQEEVAVKKISHNSRQGIREFIMEIASLGRMRHKHLVHLHGWCKHKDELLLVYDFMPNGSLGDILFNHKKSGILSWEQRFSILKGVASALLYLHEEWEQVVVHRDVKANNVLLDADMNARLGDFGLARLYDHGEEACTTHIVGTLGYIAPELSRTGKATTHCDMFSYGALLLEVACGRPPIDPNASSKWVLLLDWVRECWAAGCIVEAADPKLDNEYAVEEMELVMKLGLICCQKMPEARPTMREVICYLDGSDNLPSDLSPEYLDVYGNKLFAGSCSSSLGFSGINSSTMGGGVISSGSLKGGRH
ncbi:L-type lectin-domain containing receptor kinase SIT2 [Vitis vinifera]|uniref:L-type lectin-domain containing receptor kinase SIT2 n=1 Tax=Vitis vinifera TaxID=29760 RepID=UPI00053F4BA2|nr:L-type lectin-domain containing receptor kinase SIT2 [Vitis vinifera]